MKTNCPSKLAAGSLMLAAVTTASAQSYATGPAPAAGPGMVNEWLRKQSDDFKPWDLGGQFRVRYENKNDFGTTQFGGPKAGADDFKVISPSGNNNVFTMERFKPHLGYKADWFSVFVEGRGSYSTGDVRNPNFESDGPMALYQAYVTIGNQKEFPLSLKVGRQELAYGEERLVGTADWINNSRVFDGAKVRWENSWFAADFFTSRVVLPDDNNFNIANDYDWFSGIYATSKLIPKQTTELYFLSRNDSIGSATAIAIGAPAFLSGPAPRDIYTVGTRWKSLPDAWAGWDYTVETAYQFGHFNDSFATVKSLKQEAYMVSLQGGYTWKESKFSPRLGLEYNFASGDNNATDGTHGTFENLFPSNHKFYGYMDLVSLQNIHNIRLTSSLKPLPRLTLAGDFHMFWLANTQDNFYTVAGGARRGATLGSNVGDGKGYGINPTYGNYVGSEVDLTASFALCKSATLQVGYSHFFVGDYIKKSLAAPGVGSQDANYLYTQVVLKF